MIEMIFPEETNDNFDMAVSIHDKLLHNLFAGGL
jgi:hypothetical protein